MINICRSYIIIDTSTCNYCLLLLFTDYRCSCYWTDLVIIGMTVSGKTNCYTCTATVIQCKLTFPRMLFLHAVVFNACTNKLPAKDQVKNTEHCRLKITAGDTNKSVNNKGLLGFE